MKNPTLNVFCDYLSVFACWKGFLLLLSWLFAIHWQSHGPVGNQSEAVCQSEPYCACVHHSICRCTDSGSCSPSTCVCLYSRLGFVRQSPGSQPFCYVVCRKLDFVCYMNTFKHSDPQLEIKLGSQEVQAIFLISNWINEWQLLNYTCVYIEIISLTLVCYSPSFCHHLVYITSYLAYYGRTVYLNGSNVVHNCPASCQLCSPED